MRTDTNVTEEYRVTFRHIARKACAEYYINANKLGMGLHMEDGGGCGPADVSRPGPVMGRLLPLPLRHVPRRLKIFHYLEKRFVDVFTVLETLLHLPEVGERVPGR
jgi:hypothetical protein